MTSPTVAELRLLELGARQEKERLRAKMVEEMREFVADPHSGSGEMDALAAVYKYQEAARRWSKYYVDLAHASERR